MTYDDTATFWKWLKYLWREERTFLIWYSVFAVVFATAVGGFAFCLLISIQ
jgi:hypothetical protein